MKLQGADLWTSASLRLVTNWYLMSSGHQYSCQSSSSLRNFKGDLSSFYIVPKFIPYLSSLLRYGMEDSCRSDTEGGVETQRLIVVRPHDSRMASA